MNCKSIMSWILILRVNQRQCEFSMANWLHVLNKRLAKYPLRLAVGYSMFKAGSADIFTQSFLEKRPEVDLKRTSVFLTFGCIYQGFFQYFLWNIAFERIFPGASLVVIYFLYFILVISQQKLSGFFFLAF